MRSNFPLGLIDSNQAEYTSTNGARLGPCKVAGFTGKCWEPAEHLKGAMARTYFYMSTRYMFTMTCCDKDGVNGPVIKNWLQTVLKSWNNQYPPSAYERRRNHIIQQKYQRNRNPFIDHPDWADRIDFSRTVAAPERGLSPASAENPDRIQVPAGEEEDYNVDDADRTVGTIGYQPKVRDEL